VSTVKTSHGYSPIPVIRGPHPSNFCILRQCIHETFKHCALFQRQGCLQGMCKRALQASLPALTAVVQIRSPSGKFAGRVDLHTSRRSHNTDHLSFGQYFTTTHTSPLGHMLYTLNRFLLGHLHLKPQRGYIDRFHSMARYKLPTLAGFISAMLMLFTGNHCAKLLVKLKFDAFLLALLTFLLVCRLFLCFTSGLEDLRLHREEFIQ